MSKVTVSFQIDEEVSAVLAEAARASGRDVAQLVRALAEDYARQQEPFDEPDWLIQEIDEGIREADATAEEGWIPHEVVKEEMAREREELLRLIAEQERARR